MLAWGRASLSRKSGSRRAPGGWSASPVTASSAATPGRCRRLGGCAGTPSAPSDAAVELASGRADDAEDAAQRGRRVAARTAEPSEKRMPGRMWNACRGVLRGFRHLGRRPPPTPAPPGPARSEGTASRRTGRVDGSMLPAPVPSAACPAPPTQQRNADQPASWPGARGRRNELPELPTGVVDLRDQQHDHERGAGQAHRRPHRRDAGERHQPGQKQRQGG